MGTGSFWRGVSLALALASLAACSGGSDGPPPGNHQVDLSWNPSHERGVNAPGGGYLVDIAGRPTIDLPYVEGELAPTFVSTVLYTGTYAVTVRSYRAAIAALGETSGRESAQSTLIVKVP